MRRDLSKTTNEIFMWKTSERQQLRRRHNIKSIEIGNYDRKKMLFHLLFYFADVKFH